MGTGTSIYDQLFTPPPAPRRPTVAPRPTAPRSIYDQLGIGVTPGPGGRAVNGEQVYLRTPRAIVDAIRHAEGVPSYGNMRLLQQYGQHEAVPENVGRARTGQLVHTVYRRWVAAGKPGDFLEYLAYGGKGYAGYAPLGAANDPTNLNRNWLPNVRRHLPAEEEAAVEEGPKVVHPYGRGARRRTVAEERAATRASQEEALRQGRGYYRYGAFISSDISPTGAGAAFARGVGGAVPGYGRIVRERQEEIRQARLRATYGPQTAAATALSRGEERPTRGERAAELGGGLVGFGLLTGPALGATVGRIALRAVGPRAAAAFAPRVAAILTAGVRLGTEGAAFGILDALASDYDVLAEMPRAQALDHIRERANVSAAAFVLFAAPIEGILAGIRSRRIIKSELVRIRDEVRQFGKEFGPGEEVPREAAVAAERLAAGDRAKIRQEIRRAEAAARVEATIARAPERGRVLTTAQRAQAEAQAEAERTGRVMAQVRGLPREQGGVLLQRREPRPVPQVELPPGVERPAPPEPTPKVVEGAPVVLQPRAPRELAPGKIIRVPRPAPRRVYRATPEGTQQLQVAIAEIGAGAPTTPRTLPPGTTRIPTEAAPPAPPLTIGREPQEIEANLRQRFTQVQQELDVAIQELASAQRTSGEDPAVIAHLEDAIGRLRDTERGVLAEAQARGIRFRPEEPAPPVSPAPRAAAVPAQPEPGWIEVGRARNRREAEALIAGQQAKFPEMEVRARPAQASRPEGQQVLEARRREAAPAPQVPQEAVQPGGEAPGPIPSVPLVRPEARPLSPETRERLRTTLEKQAAAQQPKRRQAPPRFEPAATGGDAEVITERGTRVQTRYAVVEADRLVSSHDVNLRPDPRFPPELQPRARERAASEEQVQRIANTLVPEFLGANPKASQGAPIVGPDGLVESGNARVIALKRIYGAKLPKEGGIADITPPANAQAYRQWLEEHAGEFGLDPATVRGMKQPILVRIRTTEMAPEQRATFVEEANLSPVAELSDVEQARADAEKIDDQMLGILAGGDVDSLANRTFVRKFKDTIAREDSRFYTAEGELSQTGRRRIRSALFAKAYGTEDLTALTRIAESIDDDIQAVSNAMLQAAPEWARLRTGAAAGQVFPELVLNRELVRAANMLEIIRRSPGVDVPAFLGQAELFGAGEVGALTPIERRILATYHEFSRSGKRLGEILTAYPEQARAAGSPSQMDLMGGKPRPDPNLVWEKAVDAATPELSKLNLTTDLEAALDEQFSLPRPQQEAVTQSLEGALGDYGRDPRTLRSLDRIAELALKRYNRHPEGKSKPLSLDFFKRYLRAQYADTWDSLAEHSAATAYSEAVPMRERLDVATRNAELIARRKRGGAPGAPQLPPIGGGAEQKQSLGTRILEDFTAPREELLTAATMARKGLLSESDKVVGAMGPEGKELVARKRAVIDTAQLGAGEVLGKNDRLLRLSDQMWNRVRSKAEGQAITLTPKEREIFDATRAYFEPVIPRARQLAMDVGYLENYWPIMLDEKVAAPRIGQLIESIMQRTGADFEHAKTIANRLLHQQRTGRPFGNLERTREAWAPYHLRLSAKEEWVRYVQSTERRLAEVRYYGARDEIVNELFKPVRTRDPQDGAFAEAWFDAVTGKSPREAFLDGAARAATNVQTGAKMVLSVISNATQPLNNLLVVNVGTFYRGLRDITRSMTREEAILFARSTGADLSSVMRELVEQTAGTTRGTGEVVLRRTGFLRVEGGNRLTTAVMGRRWANELAEALVQQAGKRPGYLRNRKLSHIERHLRKVGLDPVVIRRQQGKLSVDQQRLAALRLVELTQFRTDPGSLPLWWTSPWGRVATQFKHFAFKQGQLVADAVFGEAKRGNFKPLVVFLTAYPLVGELVADVRLLLRRLPRSVLHPGAVLAERPHNFWRRMAENYAYVGGLGLASDLARALERNIPTIGVSKFLIGPTASELQDFLANALRGVKGIRPTAKQVVGLTVTPGLVRAFGFPGSLAGEAIESAGVFKNPPKEVSRRRSRRRQR